MGTLRIEGRSEMKLRPEITVVSMSVDGMTDDYQESVRTVAEQISELKDVIISNGIRKEDIRTADFCVKAEYDRWWDEEKKRHQTDFEGYSYHQSLQFRFPNDNEILSRIVYEAGTIGEGPRVEISFVTEHSKEYDAQLLKEAMKDAMMKADALKESGAFDIISITNVRAEDTSSDRDYGRVFYNCSEDDEPAELDFEPKEYVLRCKVEVSWEIE